MFAHTLDPSHEGRWNRFAPIAGAAGAVCSLALTLIVLVTALTTAHHLVTLREPAPASRSVVVQTSVPLNVGG